MQGQAWGAMTYGVVLFLTALHCIGGGPGFREAICFSRPTASTEQGWGVWSVVYLRIK